MQRTETQLVRCLMKNREKFKRLRDIFVIYREIEQRERDASSSWVTQLLAFPGLIPADTTTPNRHHFSHTPSSHHKYIYYIIFHLIYKKYDVGI